MQKAIVFHFTSWGKEAHIPIFREVELAGYTPIVKDNSKDKTYLSAIRNAGIQAVDWDDFLDTAAHQQIEVESARRVEIVIGQLQDPNVLQGFASPLGHFLTVQIEPFFKSLVGRVRDQIVGIETIKRIQLQYEIALVVLGFDFLDASRAVVEFAAKQGIPTLGLTHAQVNNDESARYPLAVAPGRPATKKHDTALNHVPVKYADYLAVDGAISAEHIIDWNGDADCIFPTGSTRWDGFYPPQIPTAEDRLGAIKTLGLDPNKKVVVLCGMFTHGQEGLYGLMSRQAPRFHQAVFDTLKTLPDTQLVIRPHPSEMHHVIVPASHMQKLEGMYKDWLTTQGYRDFFLIRDQKETVFAAADVVVTYVQTSVIPELIIHGKPIIGVSFHERLGSLYKNENAVLTVRGVDELPNVLTTVLGYEEVREALVRQQSASIARINYNHDGQAVPRTAHLILQLARRPNGYTVHDWRQDLAELHRPVDNALEPALV